MERLQLKYQDALHAFQSLKGILSEDFSLIVRDATIQRFEYTFEALWKFLKEYLKNEGIIANSPKACFRELFALGNFLTEEETVLFLEMTDKRNETTHTYKEIIAEEIFKLIPKYANLMEKLLSRFNNLSEE